jgi:apolipoprotein D and lipocalin family protein
MTGPIWRRIALGAGLLAAGLAYAVDADQPLRAVPRVDLARYMGDWYEVARYPNRHQRGLVGVVASYRLNDDGTIEVTNTARKGRLDGEQEISTASAWVNDGSNNAKWTVQFFWPFKAPYWIIDLGKDYEYAVVGQPKRKYLWILCRKPQMDPETYAAICKRLRQQGYDPAKLQRTPQPKPDPPKDAS